MTDFQIQHRPIYPQVLHVRLAFEKTCKKDCEIDSCKSCVMNLAYELRLKMSAGGGFLIFECAKPQCNLPDLFHLYTEHFKTKTKSGSFFCKSGNHGAAIMADHRPTVDELKALRVVDLRQKLSSLGLPQSGKHAHPLHRHFSMSNVKTF